MGATPMWTSGGHWWYDGARTGSSAGLSVRFAHGVELKARALWIDSSVQCVPGGAAIELFRAQTAAILPTRGPSHRPFGAGED